MLKWVGAVLVCAASTGLGFCLAGELKERRELLFLYNRCLLMLRGEISFGAATLPECFKTIGARVDLPFSDLFAEAGTALADSPQTSFAKIWEEAVRAHLSKTPLTDEDVGCIRQLGERMGHLDQDMQLATLADLLAGVDFQKKQAQDAYAEKAKLMRCVGTMGGFLIVLLLL